MGRQQIPVEFNVNETTLHKVNESMSAAFAIEFSLPQPEEPTPHSLESSSVSEICLTQLDETIPHSLESSSVPDICLPPSSTFDLIQDGTQDSNPTLEQPPTDITPISDPQLPVSYLPNDCITNSDIAPTYPGCRSVSHSNNSSLSSSINSQGYLPGPTMQPASSQINSTSETPVQDRGAQEEKTLDQLHANDEPPKPIKQESQYKENENHGSSKSCFGSLSFSNMCQKLTSCCF